MAARRLILAMLVLLVLSSVAAALIPVERQQSEDSTTTSSSTTTATGDEGKLLVKQVSAGAKEPPTLRMRVGDQMRLTVTSPVANTVEILEFGGFEDVDPDFPAKFDIYPFDSGSFEVRLVDPPGLVATIEVAP